MCLVQVSENGEYAPVAGVVITAEVHFGEYVVHVLFHCSFGEVQRFADAEVGSAFCHQNEHVSLSRGQHVEGILGAPREHQLFYERGVDDRFAGYNPVERCDEGVDLGDALFEQVADSRAAGEEVNGMFDFNVGRKDQYSNVRVRGSHGPRGDESLNGVSRWHPDVDDEQIRLKVVHDIHQPGGVGGLRDDVVACAKEEAGEALPQQHVVIDDDYSSSHILRPLSRIQHSLHSWVLNHPHIDSYTWSESNAMNEFPTNDLEGELVALRAGAALAAQGASPQVVLETAAGQMTGVLRADFLEILRVDHRDRTVLFAAWSAKDARIIDPDHWLLDHDLAPEVTRTQKPVRHDYISRRAITGPPSAAENSVITSSVGVPLELDGRVWGAMFVHSIGGVPLPANTEERLSHFDASMSAVVTNIQRVAVVEQLIAEQAALLRVAELVARESAAEDLFRSVAEQLGLLTRVSGAQVFRFDDEDMATSVGSWGPIDSGIKVGRQLSTRGNSVTGQVRGTGLPARVEDYSAVEGQLGALQRDVGMRSAVGAPIRSAGRLWGALIVGSTKNDPLPPETEERMARFADLVGVALSNLEARTDLLILAAEQDALRRVATAVAREDWDVILPTIARELALLHHVEGAVVMRYENEEIATILAAWGRPDLDQFVGSAAAIQRR